MNKLHRGSWSIALVCVVLGFMISMQVKATQDKRDTVSYQRVEELSDRLLAAEQERDKLKEQLLQGANGEGTASETLRMQAELVPLTGEGVIVRLDDSTKAVKTGENPNLYVIHDDDLLRVINELRAAGAEAISINGQRLTATSEIRCAGPTLSVNNVRSSAPFEIHAIGDKKSLENSLKMRGGVAETLKVWGIQLDITTSDEVYVPPYKGSFKSTYAKATEERSEKGEEK